MKQTDRWLLPEGIEEVLPPQAACLEQLRRSLLDSFACWGYELVIPPFIEYLESLLTGTGNDLNLQTFKLTDQLTGRLMGLRADMTPQVARIDAHNLQRETPTRLCYIGTVLHTRAEGFSGTRSPLQVGAEIYGHAGVESDVEILRLMVETLATSGITQPWLDLGHVGIYRGLAQQAGLHTQQEKELFDALQRKAKSEIAALLNEWQPEPSVSRMLQALSDLNGDSQVLVQAHEILQGASPQVLAALENLEQVAAHARQWIPDLNLHFDLAELRGYHYHTGVVFAAFVPGQGQAIAQGGRYDGIGEVFGRSRPATGFSTDLKTLIALSPQLPQHSASCIYAPADRDAALDGQIQALRAEGECVTQALPGAVDDARAMGCDRQLVKHGDAWRIETI